MTASFSFFVLNTIILKKLELPDIKKEWDKIFEMMDKKHLNISEEQIQETVSEVRKQSD